MNHLQKLVVSPGQNVYREESIVFYGFLSRRDLIYSLSNCVWAHRRPLGGPSADREHFGLMNANNARASAPVWQKPQQWWPPAFWRWSVLYKTSLWIKVRTFGRCWTNALSSGKSTLWWNRILDLYFITVTFYVNKQYTKQPNSSRLFLFF